MQPPETAPPGRGVDWLGWLNVLGPLLGLGVIFALFAILGSPGFASGANLDTIARQTAIVGAAALGMTLIMIMGGIDLSVGSVVALSTVAVAWALPTEAGNGEMKPPEISE